MNTSVTARRARSRIIALALSALLAAGLLPVGTQPAAAASATEDSYGDLLPTSVSGTLADAAGLPAGGVTVTAYATHGMGDDGVLASATSTGDGAFTLNFGSSRDFELVVSPSSTWATGLVQADGTVSLKEGTRRFAPGTSTSIGPATLSPGIAVSGQVALRGLTTATTGEITLAPAAGGRPATAQVSVHPGANTWSLGVTPGDYIATFSSSAAALHLRYGEGAQSKISVERAPIADISFESTVTATTISGYLRTAEGTPVSGSVDVGASALDRWHSARANADGYYQLVNIRPGSYTGNVMYRGVQTYFPDWARESCVAPLNVYSSSTTVRANFTVGSNKDCVALPGSPSPSSQFAYSSDRASFYWSWKSGDVAQRTGAIVRLYASENSSTPLQTIDTRTVLGWTGGSSVTADLTVAPGKRYWWSVATTNEFGESAESWRSTLDVPVGRPSSVQNVRVTPRDGGVGLAWDPPAVLGGDTDISYEVATYQGETTKVKSASHTVTGLTNGGFYSIHITAINSAGRSAAVSVSSNDYPKPGRAPLPPTNARTDISNGKIDVSWRPPQDTGGREITSYTVTASPGGQSLEWRPGDRTSYMIEGNWSGAMPTVGFAGLKAGASHTFTVVAHNELGTSSAVTTTGVAPSPLPPVTDLAAYPDDSTVHLSWAAPPGAVWNTRYVITISPGGETVTMDRGRTEATITSLTNGTPYIFTVQAENAVGLSDPASIGPITPCTRPSEPQSPVVKPADGQVTLSWTPPSDSGGTPIVSYEIVVDGAQRHYTKKTSLTISGLTNGRLHTFELSASNAVGSSSPIVLEATPRGAPGQPRTISTQPLQNAIQVRWTQPESDGGSEITGYTVSVTPGAHTVTVPASALSATVPGLLNGSRYSVTVSATNALGRSLPAGPAATDIPAIRFTDVSSRPGPTYSQFATEIAWMATKGVTTGYKMSDGTSQYRPYGTVTRDAMAAFLYRYAGSPAFTAPQVSPFVDVPTSNTFYKEITWLASTGITTGWNIGGGKMEYRPYSSITRDAMAAFLYRYAGKPAYTAPKVSPFIDVPTSNTFYTEITWLASTGTTTGWDTSGGKKEFRPFAPITRDAMAAFLYRYNNLPQ